MTKKLGLGEAQVKDAVLRNKTNSISATYHLLSRRHSKGYGFRGRNSKFVLDGRSSRDPDRLEHEYKFDEEESESLSYIQSANDRLKEVEESPDASENQRTTSEINERMNQNQSGGIEPTTEHSKLNLRQFKPISGRHRTYSSEQKTVEEIVTIDRKGVITQSKPYSTTVITLPKCTLDNNQSNVPSEVDYKSVENVLKEVTPRQSYKDCLRKLRYKRTISPNKGILKISVGEDVSRPNSVVPEGENTSDDLLSSADALPTDSCDAYKRQSSASAKSVRFHLNEEEKTSLRSKTAHARKMKSNADRHSLRNLSAEKSGRRRASSRDSQRYTWGSSSTQGSSKERLDRTKVIRPNSYLLDAKHQPTAAPPNSAQGFRWRSSQDQTREKHSPVTFRREPSVLSNSSNKTRKQILDRYKLKVRSGDGSHDEQSLIVNVTVVDCNPVSKTNKYVSGLSPRNYGNVRGRTITLVRHNPLYKGTSLPPATPSNTDRSLTIPGSFLCR